MTPAGSQTASVELLSLSCSRPRLSCVSSDFFVVLVTAKAFVDRSLRRRLSVESQSGWPFIYGPGFTGSGSSWGAPLSTSSAVFFTNFKRCASSLPLLTIADSQICEFLPLARVSSVCSYGYGLLKSDPPPYSPLETSVLSSQLRFSHRESLSGRRPPPHRFSSYPPNWRMVSALLPSLDSTRLAAGCRAHSAAYLLHRRCHSTVVTLAELGQNNLLVGLISLSAFNFSPVSQPNNQWGILVFLAIFLKIFDGFIKIFTETE